MGRWTAIAAGARCSHWSSFGCCRNRGTCARRLVLLRRSACGDEHLVGDVSGLAVLAHTRAGNIDGTGATAIDGPADRAITPAMVTSADPATWDTIRAIGPYGA